MANKLFTYSSLVSLFFIVSCAVASSRDEAQPQEAIEMLLTTDKITIGTTYRGSDLYVAGVVENAEPLLWRQNRYDIVVIMQGPSQEVVIREKKKRFAMWVNADAVRFNYVPLFYALASSRQLQDITSSDRLRNLSIGYKNLQFRGSNIEASKEDIFRSALVDLKSKQGLYSVNVAAVHFGKGSLFSARFFMPPNVPVGQYRATAYLFKDGILTATAENQFSVVKAHFANSVSQFAHRHGAFYGLICVLLAVVTSFVGRLLFRKD